MQAGNSTEATVYRPWVTATPMRGLLVVKKKNVVSRITSWQPGMAMAVPLPLQKQSRRNEERVIKFKSHGDRRETETPWFNFGII
jgi:hypothetical protein